MAGPTRILIVGDDFSFRAEAESDEEIIFLERILNLADAAFSAKQCLSKLSRILLRALFQSAGV
jgi:hypothetical protein